MKKKIEDIIKDGIEKALVRLNRISTGKWKLESLSVGPLKPEDDEYLCVYLALKEKDLFSSLLTVNKKFVYDVFKEIKGSFVLPGYYSETIYELFINEVGNIILNSILSGFANLLKISIVPEYPKTINGSESFVVDNIFSFVDGYHNKGLISVRIVLKGSSCEIPFNIYLFVSENLIREVL